MALENDQKEKSPTVKFFGHIWGVNHDPNLILGYESNCRRKKSHLRTRKLTKLTPEQKLHREP